MLKCRASRKEKRHSSSSDICELGSNGQILNSKFKIGLTTNRYWGLITTFGFHRQQQNYYLFDQSEKDFLENGLS